MFYQTIRREAAGGGEMRRVETLARVRRAFHIQGWSVKKIVRDLYVSCNTVHTILRCGETDFSYERRPMSRLRLWQDRLEQMLGSNAVTPSGARLSLIRVFEELRGLGYEVSAISADGNV
jgi:hypothetical protein